MSFLHMVAGLSLADTDEISGRSFGFPRRADGSGLVDFKYGILLIPYFELTSVDLLVLMFELEGVVD